MPFSPEQRKEFELKIMKHLENLRQGSMTKAQRFVYEYDSIPEMLVRLGVPDSADISEVRAVIDGMIEKGWLEWVDRNSLAVRITKKGMLEIQGVD